MNPEVLQENPILFGDFLSVTAEREDRLYDEFTDIRKIQSNLQEVSDVFQLGFLLKDIAFLKLNPAEISCVILPDLISDLYSVR